MNPHLNFAQARMGSASSVGDRAGIIEMRDLCLLLDAARILQRAGTLSDRDRSDFEQWLRAYRDWLVSSPQGNEECRSLNNHGTYYDLQVASIASYLGDSALLVAVFQRARARLHMQFNPDGSQPEELRRTNALHYCAFNLQAWIALADVGAGCGEDLWCHQSSLGGTIECGVEWLLRFAECDWPYSQLDPFDRRRLAPLKAALSRQRLVATPDLLEQFRASPVHSAHFGIRPYWFL